MWHRRRARLLRRLVLGLAIVAVAAPVAQARNDEGAVAPSDEVVQGVPTRGDDKVGLDVWQITGIPVHADDKVGLQPSTSPTLVAHPDNRAVRTGPGYEGTVGAEYRQYAYRGMLPSDYGRSNVIVAVDRTGDGFDWGDAGIGAGTLFAVGLLAAGAFALTRHLSRPATA